MRRALRAVVAAVGVAGTASAGFAQPGIGLAGSGLQPEPLLMAVPGAAEAPPAPWLQPGARLTFSSTSSIRKSHAGKPPVRPAEPHETPDFEDTKGNKWKYDQDNKSQGESQGKVGWATIDVVAIEPGFMILQRTDYLLPHGYNQPATQTGNEPMMVHPTGGRFVLNPMLLRQVPQVSDADFTIARRPFDLNGVGYDALHIVNRRGGFQMEVYDLASGVLLAGGYQHTAQGGKVIGGDDYIQSASSVMQTNYRFAASRTLNLPWLQGGVPDWARQARRLRYVGDKRLQIETFGMGDLPPTPCAIEFTLLQAGRQWTLHESSYVEQRQDGVPFQPAVGRTLTGPGTVLGLWRDPATLAGLTTGQVLDHDNVTGQRSFVEFAGPGQDGRPIVVITAATAVQKLTHVHDAADGRTIQIIRVDHEPSVPSNTVYTLHLAGMQ